MRIVIETIPHETQRYPTVGDWTVITERGQPMLHIKVSQEVGDWRAQALVAVHELVETLMCLHDGVKETDVDAFDFKYEGERRAGLHSEIDEPGDDAGAPYYRQHQIATGVERILAAQLGVDWNTYAKTIESL